MARFSGRVTIALEVMEPTSTIVLHAKELDVELVGARPATASRSPPTLSIDAGDRAHHGADGASARTGPGRAGPAVRRAREPRACSATTAAPTWTTTGAERVLAATQFEAPHARRAFPCFDEPEFKASFDVTLVVADGLLAISNGPEIGRESLGDGRVRVHFAPTIPMSTYLVAWVVGPLELTEPVDAGGVAVRVAHVPGQGAPHPVRARRRLVRDHSSSPTTTASRIPARSATSSRSPTSRSARWRTSAA